MANTIKNTQYDKNNPVFSVQDFVCSGNIYSFRLSKMRKTLMMKKWGRSKRSTSQRTQIHRRNENQGFGSRTSH